MTALTHDAGLHTAPLRPAAAWLTQRLTGPVCQLGVFLPAGFPAPRHDVAALRLFAASGADILEVGIPDAAARYDGPVIRSAYRQALGAGTRVADAIETVQHAASTTDASVVVMTYWQGVKAYTPARFADDLASAGAAGAMIVDLPAAHTASWTHAARSAGIHTPHLVSRTATDHDLAHAAEHTSGWTYVPAAEALTGYTGDLNTTALASFTRRLRATSTTPVVTGIGISTPDKAAQVRHLVNGCVIGSPIVRPLLHTGGSAGLRFAADTVAAFAEALRSGPR
ncbi:tryptophan synthase subunit alpha [Streptomyces venezuelae]|uniref:tryptophan synthase subunit alpha n=1 Tax=Streptomyces venezuelae TaxID=54571 RepID=UPI0034172376